LASARPPKVADSDKLEMMRHSASHVLAEAVLSVFPGAKFGIGPATQDGFYYDFELPRPLTTEDLPVLEAKMKEIVAADLPFTREEVTKEKARRLFSAQPYKLELIDEIADEKVGVYRQGNFLDLCRGPHVSTTGQIKAFRLVSIAGAYWRGDEHRPMLQRVYGVAFATEKALVEYLERLEEAARRDHRKLGKELDLFSLHEEAGPGLVHWHPKGSVVRRVIEDFWKDEHVKRGYDLVYTPHIAKLDLWQTSGHWDFYRENMYSPMDVEGQEYVIKPISSAASTSLRRRWSASWS
jgi:threonyl-tRNA synthetase